MVIKLTSNDIIYINNKYPNLETSESGIEGELDFKVEYKDFFIQDKYTVKISLIPRKGSILPTVTDLGGRGMEVAKKYGIVLDDVHVNSDNTFCLVNDEEEKKYLTNGFFNWPDFFEKILEPYLFQMSFYDDEGYYPIGERAHGFLAYLELYEEGEITLERLLHKAKINKKDLKREIKTKGHHDCLCGSGKNIRNCHKQILKAFYKLRKEYG